MDEKGTVYFFTGLSGAGKTTLGGLFYKHLKTTKPNVVCLDGDGIRPVFMEDLGYTSEERRKGAARIFRVCKLLSDQGIDVVCCSISMYQEVRDWNRSNIKNYKEIYVRVEKETLLKRNQKGLYTSGKNVVGVDLPFEEPEYPDLIVQNDGEETPEEIVQRLENLLCPKAMKNPQDNTLYWNQYYKNRICPEEPSLFARWVATLIEPNRKMVELGCGNGRDAVYFAGLGIEMLALDLSKEAIEQLQKKRILNARFLCTDFVGSDIHQPESYDYAYSRFTIHSINQTQEKQLITNVFCGLKPGGRFFIEVRSIHDPIYGKGEEVERNAFFYDCHYRRFIDMDELCEKNVRLRIPH